MINRVILLVFDGLGVGALSDADEYGDGGADSLGHLAEAVGGLSLPNLESLGLGHLAAVKGVRTMAQPTGSFGRLSFSSYPHDSMTGNWELSGVGMPRTVGRYREGLPTQDTAALEQLFSRKTIGQSIGRCMAMLAQYGAEHEATGSPIVWTDGANTCHLAAHESILRAAVFQQRCREVRKVLQGRGGSLRVVAHSFGGKAGAYRETARKDYVSEPPAVLMSDVLNRSNQIVMGIGKTADLFAGRGFTRSFPAASPLEAFEETLAMLSTVPRGLLYVSLDPFPEDSAGSAAMLEEIDRRLPELFDKLRVGDLVFITADHGRDVTRAGGRATREYAPLLLTGPKLAQGVNLGTRSTAADVGQTIVDALGAERLPVGESFLEALRPG
jgi:phosphopentomutase